MLTIDILEKPAKRILTGFLLLALGVLLGWFADNKSAELVRTVCGDEPNLWCFPVKLALADLGLKGLTYTLIVLGCLLIVLYDYIAELLGAILSFALNHVANSSNVVINAMERNRITREESANIIEATMSRYMGYFDKNSESFAKFLIENFVKQVDDDGGFWRKDYSLVVNVEETTDVGIEYLRWFETSRFTVQNSLENKTYHYSSGSSIEVRDVKDVEDIIKKISYEVRAGGKTEFSFASARESFDIKKLISEKELTLDKLKLTWNEYDLGIYVSFPLEVKGTETDIVVDEESYISRDDPTYELSFYEPTKGFTFRFNLPDGYNVFHSGVSGRRFGTRTTSDIAVSTSTDSKNRVRIDANSWCLPGIVTMLVWKKDA